MKKIATTLLLTGIFLHNLYAEPSTLTTQEFPKQELQKQKVEVATMVSEEISKTLPQKIDDYTVLTKVTHDGPTIVYTFEINSGAKSDDAIIKEDHSRMQRAVMQGVCQSSRKFLAAGINTRYIYISSKSKRELFVFNITQNECDRVLK